MSGAPYRAANGTLTFMVGGDDDAVADSMPAFEAMGEVIHHLGPTGTGLACKVVNNFVGVTGVVAVRKALAAAQALSLDRRKLLEVMRTSSGSTWYGDNIDAIDWAREGYDPANTIGIIEKDMMAFVDALGDAPGALESAVLDAIRAMPPLTDLPSGGPDESAT